VVFQFVADVVPEGQRELRAGRDNAGQPDHGDDEQPAPGQAGERPTRLTIKDDGNLVLAWADGYELRCDLWPLLEQAAA